MNNTEELEKLVSKMAAEKGEPVTADEIEHLFLSYFLKKRRENQLEDFTEEEIEVLNKWYKGAIKALEDDPELQAAIEEAKKGQYRTLAKAGEVVTDYPEKQALISYADYKNALSFLVDDKSNAYLSLLPSLEEFTFTNGKMMFKGTNEVISEADILNLRTKDAQELSKIDLFLLRDLYTLILKESAKVNLNITDMDDYKPIDRVSIYVPELYKALGNDTRISKESINFLILNINKFENIVGCIKSRYSVPSMYKILQFNAYDPNTNTITFQSPYMEYVIKTLLTESVRKDSKGKPKLKKDGEPQREATHSYSLPYGIKERDKAALENVAIILQVLSNAGNPKPMLDNQGKALKDQSGNTIYNEYITVNIAASTLIERNIILKARLDEAQQASRRTILRRIFKNTWRILREKTDVLTTYKDIILPDEKNPANIPTNEAQILSTVFIIKHKGKIKKP